MIPASTTTISTTNNNVINNGMTNNHHQDVVDSTSDNRSSVNQQRHANNITSSDATATSATNPPTASYSHIQELKMNDAYMVNALTEAAVATRAAVAAKSVQHQQQQNSLQTSKYTSIDIFSFLP